MLRIRTTAVRLSSGHDGNVVLIFKIVFPGYDMWKTPFIVKMSHFYPWLIESITHAVVWVKILNPQYLECKEERIQCGLPSDA